MNKQAFEAVALTVRTLSMDAVQKANSGHPGLPMGDAELGALLYGEILRHNPKDPNWVNRDRFVLSAGHGSMFLYSLLYLSGYDISLEDIRNFRQLGYKTPGHPEFGHTAGVDTTTGPLGQGFANAVGMAIAEQMLAAKFNTGKHAPIDHFTYVLAGDGCMMEGVTSEAASLAGHLGLGKLIVFYDSNRITIEGSTELAFTEDVKKRFDAYGWHTQEGDAYDADSIRRMTDAAKKTGDRPSLIVLHSTIAKGSPGMAGSHEAHGAPLGEKEIRATRKALGVPEDAEFYVHPEAPRFFEERRKELEAGHREWQKMRDDWAKENPALAKEWEAYFSGRIDLSGVRIPEYKAGDKVATRKAGGQALAAVREGGSESRGRLGRSRSFEQYRHARVRRFHPENQEGRTLHFGVREHAMGAVVNGIVLHGGPTPSAPPSWSSPTT